MFGVRPTRRFRREELEGMLEDIVVLICYDQTANFKSIETSRNTNQDYVYIDQRTTLHKPIG